MFSKLLHLLPFFTLLISSHRLLLIFTSPSTFPYSYIPIFLPSLILIFLYFSPPSFSYPNTFLSSSCHRTAGLPETAMNTLALGSCIGAVSESLHDSIQEYVATNPDNAVSEVMTERLVKVQESTSVSAAADIALTTFMLCRTFLTTTLYATVPLIFLSALSLLIVSHLSIYLTTSLHL